MNLRGEFPGGRYAWKKILEKKYGKNKEGDPKGIFVQHEACWNY